MDDNGWLVLGRNKLETLIITAANGQQVVVKIAAIKGNRVQVAVKAERSVEIRRGELLRAA